MEQKSKKRKAKEKRKKKVEGRLFSSGAVSVETRRGQCVGQDGPGKSWKICCACLPDCRQSIPNLRLWHTGLSLTGFVLTADGCDLLTCQVEAKRTSWRRRWCP